MLFTIANVNPRSGSCSRSISKMSSCCGRECRFSSSPTGRKTESLGHIAWISHEADEKTRTVKVRVDVDNNAAALVVHSFGCGRVVLRREPKAILVPNDAIQWEGCCNVVFVKDRRSLNPEELQIYHVRQVRLGSRNGKDTEILAGLLPGEHVVTKGSGVLKGELLKSRIGAAD